MLINDISGEVVDAAYQVHTIFGPGLLESIYERALYHELADRGLEVSHQVPIPAEYKGIDLGISFRADLIVNDLVIVEVKSVEYSAAVHKHQLLSYLRLTDKRVGLLVNFGRRLIKQGITRVVNNYY